MSPLSRLLDFRAAPGSSKGLASNLVSVDGELALWIRFEGRLRVALPFDPMCRKKHPRLRLLEPQQTEAGEDSSKAVDDILGRTIVQFWEDIQPEPGIPLFGYCVPGDDEVFSRSLGERGLEGLRNCRADVRLAPNGLVFRSGAASVLVSSKPGVWESVCAEEPFRQYSRLILSFEGEGELLLSSLPAYLAE